MPTMSLDKQIKQSLPQLDNEQKQSILSVIKSFLKLKDTSQPTERITVEQYNKEIDEAMERVAKGEFYTHEEVEEMSKKW